MTILNKTFPYKTTNSYLVNVFSKSLLQHLIFPEVLIRPLLSCSFPPITKRLRPHMIASESIGYRQLLGQLEGYILRVPPFNIVYRFHQLSLEDRSEWSWGILKWPVIFIADKSVIDWGNIRITIFQFWQSFWTGSFQLYNKNHIKLFFHVFWWHITTAFPLNANKSALKKILF